MKILVKFNKNIATPKQVKSFKVFDLGEVVTTIDDLLDVSSIQITDDILPILKITDVDGEKQYLVNGLGEPSNGIIPYYTDDFEKDITIDDLVLLGGSGGSSESAYKVYTALLTQSGTDAPVATVLENTLGGDVVWSREDVGVYTGVLNGAFIQDKTFLYSKNKVYSSDDSTEYSLSDSGVNKVYVTTTVTRALEDGVMLRTPIEIRVYN